MSDGASRSAKSPSDVAIIILGFAGARPHHMDKYAKVWQERGYDTLCFTADNVETESMLLCTRRNVDDLIVPLKKLLESRDIALHVFSMNGVWSLCSLDMNYPELKLFERTRGILFDSAPIDLGFASLREYFDVWTFSHAAELKKASTIRRYQLYFEAYSEITKLIGLYSKLAARRTIGMSVKEWSGYDYLMDHPHRPKIQTTLQFARAQSKAGSIVRLLHLLDSSHVNHMRTYPVDYVWFIDRFLDELKTKPKV